MRKARVVELTVVVFGVFLTLGINYHWFVTDFNLVPGDRGDSRLVIFTLEHWLNFFKGREAFFVLGMFYPEKIALAYADGLFLFAIPYSLFRLVGFDYFTSYQLLFPFMTILGYSGFLLVLRKFLRLDPFFAVLGSVLLTSLNSMQFQADIGKLLGIYFYPVIIGLLLVFLQDDGKPKLKAWLSLTGSALGLGLLFFTSYYPAWFLLFTIGLFALVSFGFAVSEHGLVMTSRRAALTAWENRYPILTSFFALAFSLLPFAMTYATLVGSKANRSFNLVLEFSPTVVDVINVSARNLVWSPLLRQLDFDFGNREVQMGSPILAVLLFMVFFSRQLWFRARGNKAQGGQDRFILILCTTAFVILLLTCRVGDFSLWYFVYKLVPGASALRALGRYLMIVDMIMIVAIAYGLNNMHRSGQTLFRSDFRFVNGILVVLSLALIAEQINTTAFRLDKAEQISFLGGYKEPPASCEAFFINNATTSDFPFGYYQLDAMMISMSLGIPTVNGYSGFEPHEAFTMVPRGIEYKYEILNWLRQNGVNQGICELDYESRAFRNVDIIPEHEKSEQLNRANYLETFSTLFSTAKRFLTDGNDLANLYPQYLEEHGYLDPSFGYQTGPGFRWMQNRYWIGERLCHNGPCFGIGIVGVYSNLQPILESYQSMARQVFFPYPEDVKPGSPIPTEAEGQLLMIFRVSDIAK